MPTKILVVGGAGYIGSHMVAALHSNNMLPIVLDNLSTGHAHAVEGSELIIGDMSDSTLLDQIFSQHQFSAVMHFASCIRVDESLQNPAKYYQNNVANTLVLLQAMLKWQVKNFIFSSSAAVYGEPKYIPIDEEHPLLPINPYGRSKYMVEQILKDFSSAFDFRFVSLRYFNAAGADPGKPLYECHIPETHLIPLVLKTALEGLESVSIYGNQYSTIDGTCIRDYIHVVDICHAHLLALQALLNGHCSSFFNLGTGHGYSVQQVIETAREVTQCDIPTNIASARVGDPAVLVADARSAQEQLGWYPQYSSLQTIIQHAWQSFVRQKATLSEVN
jgi:UDP-glucose 4-epimerase